MSSELRNVVVGVILLMIAFIMFGVILDSIDMLLSWTGAGGTTLEDFTGLEPVIRVSAIIIFLGLLASGGWLTFSGLRGATNGGGRAGRGLH